jgi:membrane protein YqaA with SNARE-associated domain
VKKVLTMTGATLGGAVGWWLGDKLGGTMTAFVLSMVATGVGVYAGIKVAQRYD